MKRLIQSSTVARETRPHLDFLQRGTAKKISALALAFLFPSFAFAADDLQGVFCILGQLVLQLTPIVFALALLAFFWGLAMYMFSLSGGDGAAAHSAYGAPASPQGKQSGRTIMMWGLIVLFVMVSVWGLVKILQTTFGINGGSITPPSLTGTTFTLPENPSCR